MSTGRCVIDDDANALRDILYASDGIVLASPAHGMMPTARMKHFLVDRIGMYTAYNSRLGGKYFVAVSTAGGIGAKNVVKALTEPFLVGFHQRSYRSGCLHAHLGYQHVTEVPQLKNRARALGKKLVEDIRHRRRYRLQKLADRLVNRLLVRKIIMNNSHSHRDGQLNAVYDDLTARHLIPRVTKSELATATSSPSG